MISQVTYNPALQDQATATATQDEQGNVTAITIQVIRTFSVVDDGTGPTGGSPPLTVKPSIMSIMSAVDPNGNAVPTAGDFVAVDGQGPFCVTQAIPRRTSQSPFVFEVQCTFVQKYQEPQGQKWNITISIAGQEFTQTAYEATAATADDGTNWAGPVGATVAIVNSAKQSFDPSLPKTYYDQVISISYNTLDADSGQFASLRGCVNSDNVSFNIQGQNRTFQPKQVLVKEISQSTTISTGDTDAQPIWKVSVTLVARQDKFTRNVLDAGYYQLDPNDNSKITMILDKYGQPLNAPGRLNGQGSYVGPSGQPAYLAYDVEDEAEISSIFEGLS